MITRRISSTVMLLTLLAMAGCDWMPGKPTEADKPVIKSTITNSHVLWTTYCSGCHGADVRWGPARPMNDPLYLATADRDYLIRIVRDGVEGSLMPAFGMPKGGPMTDEQVNELVDGMIEHWSNPAAVKGMDLPPLSSTNKGDVARGHDTFKTYCAQCHGDDGRGASAGSVVNDSYLALVTDQALRSTVICGRLDLGMPNYAGYAGGHKSPARQDLPPLSNQQIDDVVAWLVSHRAQFPGQPYPNTNTLEDTTQSAAVTATN